MLQPEMDRYLEAEMRGAIFCDPNFVDNFLAADTTKLGAVMKRLKQQPTGVRLPKTIKRERQLYRPIREMLNGIKNAVDAVLNRGPSSGFVDVSSQPIPSDEPDTNGIKPRLALFGETYRHWETVRMPIELKKQATFLKTGMKQLTRYARAVFAHQLHRRHLYGLVICRDAATFVRFDRSGILYSKPLNVRDKLGEFQRAFAGLMMLNEEDFGQAGAAPEPPTRKLKVVERIYHRKSIRGCATIVLRVQDVLKRTIPPRPAQVQDGLATRSRKEREAGDQQPREVEELGPRQHVLKLMWHDTREPPEGEALKRLEGTYGVAQYVSHGDMLKGHGCHKPADDLCDTCSDTTPGRDNLQVAENLTDLNIEIPEEAKGQAETKYHPVQTDKYSPAHAHRKRRTYCWLLVATIGRPLYMAESPQRLLQAVLDAILGYWHTINEGLLHRDISEGNVLLLDEGQGYNKRGWKGPRLATHEQDMALETSKKLLREVVDKLDRDPSGMLSDFDLVATHSWITAAPSAILFGKDGKAEALTEPELKPNAVPVLSSDSSKGKGLEPPGPGDPSVLRAAGEIDEGTRKYIDFRTVEIGSPYEHHFMDDLESFFWLIVWCVAQHVDRGKTETEAASTVLNQLDRSSLDDMAAPLKVGMLASCSRDGGSWMKTTLRAFENTWAADPGPIHVILELGKYFFDATPNRIFKYTPAETFSTIVKIILDGLAKLQSTAEILKAVSVPGPTLSGGNHPRWSLGSVARTPKPEYFVNLPAAAFPPEAGTENALDTVANTTTDAADNTLTATPGPSSQPIMVPELPARKLKVVERIYLRKSIQGCPMIVLPIQDVIKRTFPSKPAQAQSGLVTLNRKEREPEDQPREVEELGLRQYMLKLMWRDTREPPEGEEALKRLECTYGVAQYVSHGDMLKGHGCHKPADDHCNTCSDTTPGLENLTDLGVEIAKEAEGEVKTEYRPVQTDKCSPAHAHRKTRTYCRLPVSTIGRPLYTAENPQRFLRAVLDGILGYWHTINEGLLHRDISDGNVLLLDEGQGYNKRGWKDPHLATNEQDMALETSEKLLREVVDKLDRDPTGMLSDFDLFATHDWITAAFFAILFGEDEEAKALTEPELKSNAAPVLSSGSSKSKSLKTLGPQVPSVPRATAKIDGGTRKYIDFRTVEIGSPYEHHFMDDLESFFWLIVWCVAQHVDRGKTETEAASTVLNQLDRSSLGDMAIIKVGMLTNCVLEQGFGMQKTLGSLKNSWAADPGIVYVILRLGEYFYGIKRQKILEYTPAKAFSTIVQITMDGLAKSQSP
ncbi:hypothetical protein FRC10_000596 [Ceratobasidium sp. 414]|nr:hypothetical protein FRC10_000596 [Ceratobasidium sp. 414]